MDGPFVKIVVPTVGIVLSIIMLGSPYAAVWQIRNTQTLGAINPLPYPLTCINCLSWVVYGAVAKDPFIPPANMVGLALGILFTMSVLPACTRKMQDILQVILASGAFLFTCLALVSTFALDDAGRKQMWGLAAIVSLMVYYIIPLSSMYQIIKSRDAASIYIPLAVASLVNGGLWTTYGLAIMDINVYGPNVFGVLMSLIQIGLRLLLGAKQHGKNTELAAVNVTGAEYDGHVEVTHARDSHEGLLEQTQATGPPEPALSTLSNGTGGTWQHTPKHLSSSEV